MDLCGWDARYSSGAAPEDPTPLVVDFTCHLKPGRALDLACGAGRNALWLASNGWRITAVDGSSAAIKTLRSRKPRIETHLADLERGEFKIEESAWDLILDCYYLQRDLFEAMKRGVAPGGIVISIVHICETGESPTKSRLEPGQLVRYFEGWEILHSREGRPRDASHRRLCAEIVARRPVTRRSNTLDAAGERTSPN